MPGPGTGVHELERDDLPETALPQSVKAERPVIVERKTERQRGIGIHHILDHPDDHQRNEEDEGDRSPRAKRILAHIRTIFEHLSPPYLESRFFSTSNWQQFNSAFPE